MRRWMVSLTLVVALTIASSAMAEGLNSLKAGITGLIQSPADIFSHVISPPEDFEDEIPFGMVTGRMLGLVTGPLLGSYRAVMGVTDIVFTAFWVFPVMSPEPRWEWFEDVEYGI